MGKNKSSRSAYRGESRLALEVVRREERIRQAAERRPEDSRRIEEEARVGLRAEDFDRARGDTLPRTILTARPGVVIGRGAEIDKLKEELSKMTGKEIYVDIMEIKQPETDAQLVAENVALQLERRVSFRRAMKKALQTAMDFGAEGIKIRCAGRLGGAELARGNVSRRPGAAAHVAREY